MGSVVETWSKGVVMPATNFTSYKRIGLTI
jgi:hypothetical protein